MVVWTNNLHHIQIIDAFRMSLQNYFFKERDNNSPYSYTLLTNSIILTGNLFYKRVISDPCLCYLKFTGIDFYPRGVGQQAYHKLIYYNTLDKGGGFAAWVHASHFQYPDLFLSHARSTHFSGQVIEMSRGGQLIAALGYLDGQLIIYPLHF